MSSMYVACAIAFQGIFYRRKPLLTIAERVDNETMLVRCVHEFDESPLGPETMDKSEKSLVIDHRHAAKGCRHQMYVQSAAIMLTP